MTGHVTPLVRTGDSAPDRDDQLAFEERAFVDALPSGCLGLLYVIRGIETVLEQVSRDKTETSISV